VLAARHDEHAGQAGGQGGRSAQRGLHSGRRRQAWRHARRGEAAGWRSAAVVRQMAARPSPAPACPTAGPRRPAGPAPPRSPSPAQMQRRSSLCSGGARGWVVQGRQAAKKCTTASRHRQAHNPTRVHPLCPARPRARPPRTRPRAHPPHPPTYDR
jgi:hypothetical protein